MIYIIEWFSWSPRLVRPQQRCSIWQHKGLGQHQDGSMQNLYVGYTALWKRVLDITANKNGRLNAFHVRCLRRIVGIIWYDHEQNKSILAQTGIASMFALLAQKKSTQLGERWRDNRWKAKRTRRPQRHEWSHGVSLKVLRGKRRPMMQRISIYKR